MTHRSRTTRRSMLGCVVFSVTSNNSNGRFASYLHTPAYWPRQATPHPPPSGGNGPGRITLRRRSHPVHCSASAPGAAGTETVVGPWVPHQILLATTSNRNSKQLRNKGKLRPSLSVTGRVRHGG